MAEAPPRRKARAPLRAAPIVRAQAVFSSRRPTMNHLNTRFLLDEWRRQRGRARLPARTQMTAAALAPLLPQVFVLGREPGGWRFRLAGGFVCDLHGRELRGEAFAALWGSVSRPDALRALDRAAAEAEPATLHAVAEADAARWLGLEVTLAPLTGPTEAPDRMLGLYQPLSLAARLEGRTVASLRLAGVDGRAAGPAPGPRLVVDNTRRVA